MSKADNLSLSGTTNKKRITKKSIPQAVIKEAAPVKEEKLKKTNFQLTESMHMKAKITATELGVSLKDYITKLIVADLKKRGKL